jgi:DNA-binding IclR family transcriptional regulator
VAALKGCPTYEEQLPAAGDAARLIATGEKRMAYTHHELKGKTIQELRDIAKDVQHDAVQGYSQMNKEHLLPALCTALGIPIHEHHDVVGIDKPAIKAKMHELKNKRDEAVGSGDRALLKSVRRQIHGLNRQIRSHVARS